MNKWIFFNRNRPRQRIFLLIALFITCLFLPLWVSAKANLGIGIKVFEKMQEAQVFIEQKNYSQAHKILDEILTQKHLNNYEIAQTISIRGTIYFQQDDNAHAIEMFEKVLTYDNLPAGFTEITLKTVAQLAFMEEDYDKALTYCNTLLNTAKTPDANTYMLMAQIHYKREDYARALQHAQTAIAMERALGSTIREQWYLVLSAIYYSQNDFHSMVGVMQELVALYPRERYLMNLAAIYGQLEQNKQQMLLMEPLYDSGMLTHNTELMNLANLMILHKVPYKAALVIEKGFQDGLIDRSKRNLEMLAQSWQLAAEDERSIAYFTEAATLADDGNTYASLGQAYMNLYRWADAEKAFENALAKGHLRKEGNTHLLLGMTRFYLKQYLSARKAFLNAKAHEDTEKLAEQWILYMEQEQEKEEIDRSNAS